MVEFKVKRVYDESSPEDGLRVLVDRLWPRGVRKDRIDRWEKNLAPSTGLREDFHSGAVDFEEFRARYLDELQGREGELREFLSGLSGTVTLLFGLKDESHNHATILAGALRDLQGRV